MKRFGIALAMTVVAVAAMADGAWAGKCLDDCWGRCARRTRCGTVAPLGCCGIGFCGECCGMGWLPVGSTLGSCDCGVPVAEPAVPEAAPTLAVPKTPEQPRVVVPVTPAEPPVPQPPAKAAPPAEKPAPPPAARPPKAPAKPAEPKKADAPAKKVSWAGRGQRVWTDSTGQHQVTARFVATLDHGAVVRLLRADGTYVRVAFADLSLEDQQYVLGQTAKVASAR